MISNKVFAEYLKMFLVNYGFELNKEDLSSYCSICYCAFKDSYIDDNQFVNAVKKIISRFGKEDIRTRPTAYDFFNLIKQNIELNERQKAELEFNKALVKVKYGLTETVDTITEYLIDKIDIKVENKDKFIDLYIYTKNNKKIDNVQVFLIENKEKNKKNDKNKEVLDILNDLSKRLAGNY